MRGQRNAVFQELMSGNEVTNKSMFTKYGITRLSAIIYDLRHELRDLGFGITTIMLEGKTRFGDTCKYAKYILVKSEDSDVSAD